MRYAKAETVLRLALEMQGTREGLTLDDIRSRYDVSRRTAERLRDAAERVFPQFEQANPGDTPKRWRIRSGALNALATASAEELAALHAAAARLRRDGRAEQSALVDGVSAKLRALMRPEALTRVEPDLEALSEAEGLALRPGPRPLVSPDIVADLRHAILAGQTVRLHYRGRDSGALSRQLVCPYGFLYGGRHYLVAYSLNRASRDYRLFSLSNIERVEPTDRPFERRRDFSLQAYAERSFGTFQEEPLDVVWRFTPEVAADAREFVFHPSQTTREQADGSLLVRFKAGGLREMAWHLFTWGEAVEVLAPAVLKQRYRAMVAEVAEALARHRISRSKPRSLVRRQDEKGRS